ncbi:hypothetical protein IE53DRAFT_217034 [Violaceomyces palustris]|uniref:Uncharacterized protein n=1 Tax=Violaceomyces palustris TaxID=1673888 RepID=A0ACD0P537_9BASI|nr:hypothetical protein IE53DRAFT_217034 [Violaceomyces palustris]
MGPKTKAPRRKNSKREGEKNKLCLGVLPTLLCRRREISFSFLFCEMSKRGKGGGGEVSPQNRGWTEGSTPSFLHYHPRFCTHPLFPSPPCPSTRTRVLKGRRGTEKEGSTFPPIEREEREFSPPPPPIFPQSSTQVPLSNLVVSFFFFFSTIPWCIERKDGFRAEGKLPYLVFESKW